MAHPYAIRINCGAERSHRDDFGHLWRRDSFFVQQPGVSRVHGPRKGADPWLYQTARYSKHPIIYSVPVENGVYTIKLLFGRFLPFALDSRIRIENQIHLSASIAKKRNQFARQIVVNGAHVSDGKLTIQIDPAEYLSYAFVSGIVIQRERSASSAKPPMIAPVFSSPIALTTPPVQVTRTPVTSSPTRAPTRAPTSLAPVGTPAPLDPTARPTQAPVPIETLAPLVQTAMPTQAPVPVGAPTGAPLVLINSGATELFTDANGNLWANDTYYILGDPFTDGRFPIAKTTDDSIYQSERYGVFGYSIPVPTEGTYRLRLHFAEIFHPSAGLRVFTVQAEGADVLTNFDIVEEARADLTALVTEHEVTVEDGALTLMFQAVVGDPKVSGIEIVELMQS